MSPLLRLPLEIREAIYTEILGDRLIHLKYLPYHDENSEPWIGGNEWEGIPLTVEEEAFYKGKDIWSHLVSTSPYGPKNKKGKVLLGPWKGSNRLWHRAKWAYARKHNPDHAIIKGQRSKYCHELNLGFLCSCRQFYIEASKILWSTNVFSFGDINALERFMLHCKLSQKEMIRKLRLAMFTSMDMEWASVLNSSFVKSLPGMRELVLHIEHDAFHTKYHFRPRTDTSGPYKYLGADNMGGLRTLSTMTWKKVDVTVTSGTLSHCDCAGLLKDKMLDPKAAEKF